MMTNYDTACSIVATIRKNGFIAYFTGGWVRDFLMNHPSDDIDIATNASVTEIQKIFTKTIPIGVQFGIVIVVENNHHFEVATFRKDHGYEDGRRPIGIEKSTPEEDAKRRDFTINGMFYDPIETILFDYVNGQVDIEKKVIRAIGDPHQRFTEDRLRMIRAVRYACRFHFDIEPETKKAIKAHSSTLFPSVAIERVWQEFCKMKKFGNFKKFLVMLFELNLLQTIFTELESLSLHNLFTNISCLDLFPKEAPMIAKILQLFPDFLLEQKLAVCEKFKLSNEDKLFVKYYHKVKTSIVDSSMDKYQWAHLYASGPFPLCLTLATASFEKEERHRIFHFHEKKQLKLEKAVERIKRKNPVLTSQHLISAGISPGITMGHLLKEGEKIAINTHCEDPETILISLKNDPLWPK